MPTFTFPAFFSLFKKPNKTQKNRPLNSSLFAPINYGDHYSNEIQIELAHLRGDDWRGTAIPSQSPFRYRVPPDKPKFKGRVVVRKPKARASFKLCSGEVLTSTRRDLKNYRSVLRQSFNLPNCSFKSLPRGLAYKHKRHTGAHIRKTLNSYVGMVSNTKRSYMPKYFLNVSERKRIPTDAAEMISAKLNSWLDFVVNFDWMTSNFTVDIVSHFKPEALPLLSAFGNIECSDSGKGAKCSVEYYHSTPNPRFDYIVHNYQLYYPRDEQQALISHVVALCCEQFEDAKEFFNLFSPSKFILDYTTQNFFCDREFKSFLTNCRSSAAHLPTLGADKPEKSVTKSAPKLPENKVSVPFVNTLKTSTNVRKPTRALQKASTVSNHLTFLNDSKASEVKVVPKERDCHQRLMINSDIQRLVKPSSTTRKVFKPNNFIDFMVLPGIGEIEKHTFDGIVKYYILHKNVGKDFKIFNNENCAHVMFNLTLSQGKFFIDADAFTPTKNTFGTIKKGFCWLDAFAKFGRVIPKNFSFCTTVSIKDILDAKVPRKFLSFLHVVNNTLMHFDDRIVTHQHISNFSVAVGMEEAENKSILNSDNYDVVTEQVAKNILSKTNPRSDNPTFSSILQHAANKINNWNNKRSDLVIFTTLNIKEKKTITDLFPHLKFDFKDCSYSSHPVFTTMRRIMNYTLYKLVNFTDFIDFGGNLPTLIESGATNMHCCNPIVDSRDAKRHVDAALFLHESLDHNPTFTTCQKLAQVCDVKHNRAVMVEVYDMTLREIAQAMLSHDTLRCDFSLLLPGELLTDFDNVSILNNGCRIVRRGNVVDYFLGEAAEAYSHDLTTLREIMSKSLIVVDGIAFKKTLENSYGPFRHYSMVRLETFPSGRHIFSTMYDLSNKNLMLVKIPNTDINGAVSFTDLYVDRSMVLNLVEYSANCVENFNRKGFEHVFSQYRSRKNYVIYNGKVIHEQVDIPIHLVPGFVSVMMAEGMRMSEKTHYLAKYTYYSYYAPGLFLCLYNSIRSVWLKVKTCAYEQVLSLLEVIFGSWITKSARQSGGRLFEVQSYVFTEEEYMIDSKGSVNQLLEKTFEKFVERGSQLEKEADIKVPDEKLDDVVNSGGAGVVDFKLLTHIINAVRSIFGDTLNPCKLSIRLFSTFKRFFNLSLSNMKLLMRKIGSILGEVPGILLNIICSPFVFIKYLATGALDIIKKIFSWLGSLYTATKGDVLAEEVRNRTEHLAWAEGILKDFSADGVDEVCKAASSNQVLDASDLPISVVEAIGVVKDLEKVLLNEEFSDIPLNDCINSGGAGGFFREFKFFGLKDFILRMIDRLFKFERWVEKKFCTFIGRHDRMSYLKSQLEGTSAIVEALNELNTRLNHYDEIFNECEEPGIFEKFMRRFRRFSAVFRYNYQRLLLHFYPHYYAVNYRCKAIANTLTSDDFKNKLVELFFDGAISMFCTVISQAYSLNFDPISIVISPVLSQFLKFLSEVVLGASDPILPVLASSLILGHGEVSKNKLAIVTGSYFQFKSHLCEVFCGSKTFTSAIHDYVAKHNIFHYTKKFLDIVSSEFGIMMVLIIGLLNLHPLPALLLTASLMFYQRFYKRIVNIANVAIGLKTTVTNLKPVGQLKKAVKTLSEMKFKTNSIKSKVVLSEIDDHINSPPVIDGDGKAMTNKAVEEQKDKILMCKKSYLINQNQELDALLNVVARKVGCYKEDQDNLRYGLAENEELPDPTPEFEELVNQAPKLEQGDFTYTEIKSDSDSDVDGKSDTEDVEKIETRKEINKKILHALQQKKALIRHEYEKLKFANQFGFAAGVKKPSNLELIIDTTQSTPKIDVAFVKPNKGKSVDTQQFKDPGSDFIKPVTNIHNDPQAKFVGTYDTNEASSSKSAENFSLGKQINPGQLIIPQNLHSELCDMLKNYPVSKPTTYVQVGDHTLDSILEYAYIESVNLTHNLENIEFAIALYGAGHVDLRSLQTQIGSGETYAYFGFGDWKVLAVNTFLGPSSVNFCFDLNGVMRKFKPGCKDVLFSSKDFCVGYSNLKLKALDRFKHNFKPISDEKLFEGEIVNKPPGSGKTTEIAERMQGVILKDRRPLALTVTKVGKNELIDKLKGLNVNRPHFFVRTLDSYLISPSNGRVDHVFIDECYMAHSGAILAALSVMQPSHISFYGDVNQIPYICRLPHFQCNFETVVFDVMPVKFDGISYRCPADVCYILSTLTDIGGRLIYPNKVKAVKNERLRTMKTIPIHGIDTIPKESDATYITYTVSERDELNKHFKDINAKTVNEIQGGTFPKVYLVRLRTYNNPLYDDVNQFVTAISRHTETFNYYCPYNVLGDKVSSMTSGLETIGDHIVAQFGFRQSV
uniref:Polyprotein n=1 Tax=Pyrus virus A TaxID=3139198 RepID=A0AAU6RWF4_9CLOS